MDIKYANINLSEALKNLPKLIFWYENIPSGNPGKNYICELKLQSKNPSEYLSWRMNDLPESRN
jgi:hypothetical protein